MHSYQQTNLPEPRSLADFRLQQSSASGRYPARLLMSAGVLTCLACGGASEEPQTPPPTLTAVPAPIPPPSVVAPVPPAPLSTAPSVAAAPAPTTSAPAASPPPEQVAALLTPLFAPLSQQYAPGMQADGSAIIALGPSVEVPFTLSPHKCYTLVAVGTPNVASIKLELVAAAALPGFPSVLAESKTTAVPAVLGAAPTCYKWPLMVPAQVVLRIQTTRLPGAAPGSMAAAVQVYSK